MFKTAWFCISCEKELTPTQVLFSHGCCPKCGHKGKSAGTIVDTTERSYKMVRTSSGKWWWPYTFKREFAKGET